MAVMYPKFSHARPLDASKAGPVAAPRPASDARAGARRAWAPGTLLKIVLLAGLAWGLNYAIRQEQKAESAEAAFLQPQPGSAAGVALADAMLHMSASDASLLRSLPARLDGACERNKYELAQQECRARLHERGGLCLTPVARRYPEQRGNERTAPMIGAYLRCVFGD